ncbi:MAG: HD-GYP domain-containing protein, partial [Phycisphaerae bacterium]
GELLQRCRNLIRNKQAADALEDSENVIFALARIVEGRDKYTQGHVERVAACAVEIGTRMRLGDDEVATLYRGGVIHDLGKIAVPDAILNKPGRLDDHEWSVMKTHPVVGYDVLVRLRTFHDVLGIVRWHHERPNGRGYPDGIGGDELPLLPRIVAVADCFDAVTSARPYCQARTVNTALEVLTKGARCGDFDEDVVGVMCEMAKDSRLD